MGLLDYLQTPGGIGLLSGVASYAANARRGTPVNNIGRGLAGGFVGYQQAADVQRQEMEKKRQQEVLANLFRPAMSPVTKYKAGGKTFNTMQEAQQHAKAFSPNQELGMALKNEFSGDTPLPEGQDFSDYAQAPFVAPNAQSQPDIEAITEEQPQMDMRAQIMAAAQAGVIPPAEAFKLLAARGVDATAEMKNWQFAQSLPEDQRTQFLGAGGGRGAPSTVQEWQFFSSLTPEEKAAYLEMKRNPQIMNLGGMQAVRAPFGGIQESYGVTPKPTDMPGFQAQQEAAKAGARASVEQGVESSKKARTADALLSNISEAESILKTGKPSGSLVGAGVSAAKRAVGMSDDTTTANQQLKLISGWMVANVPRMEGPQSNYDVQNYREMAATVGDETIPVNDRLAALRQLRVLQEKYKTINSNQDVSFDEAEYIQKRRDAGIPDSQIVKELNSRNMPQRSNAYQEYLDAFKRAKTDAQRKAITDRARQMGVVK